MNFKFLILNLTKAIGGTALKLLSFIQIRIESILAVFAIALIGAGVAGYDKRLALIAIGSLLLFDIWFDKIVSVKKEWFVANRNKK